MISPREQVYASLQESQREINKKYTCLLPLAAVFCSPLIEPIS